MMHCQFVDHIQQVKLLGKIKYMDAEQLQTKILNNLVNNDELQAQWDSLTSTDPDYIMYSCSIWIIYSTSLQYGR